MKYLRSFIFFLVECNIFIALAAVCYTIEAQIQLGIPITWHPYLFLIFFATLLEYNLSRFFTIITRKQLLEGSRSKWVRENLKTFYAIVILSVTGFLLTCMLADRAVLIALFPLGALTLLYSFPFYGKGKIFFRLRDIPFLKIFIISLIWSTTTLLLPAIQSGMSFTTYELAALAAERFLFIFAITIPFDIRDMKSDREAGTKTLPLFLGERRALLLAYAALTAFTMIVLLRHDGFEKYALLVSCLITFFALANRKWQNLFFYHYLILDGMIVLQALLVILAYYYTNLA